MDWEVKRFDDTFEHVPSKPFQLQSSEYREGGRFQVVDQGQMEIVGYTDDDKKLFHVPEGGVIIFGDHTRIVKFRESDFVVGADGTQLLVGKNDCTRFLFYVLQQLDIPNLGYSRHFKYVKEGRYAVPPTLAEQKAIAAALSDMDAEIAALEADRAKYESIKQGMMQELLTGKTRIGDFAVRGKAQDATAGIGSDL
jgi:type I restriction enzyme S subunit